MARATLRCGALLFLSFAAYMTLHFAWADHLSRADTAGERERALRLALLPEVLQRAAEKLQEEGGNSVPLLRQAALAEPANPVRWLRLGAAAEWNGDSSLAEQALHRAAGVSRLYQPRYLLAQHYFRRQRYDAFVHWMQAALDVSYGDVRPLIDLDHRMEPDADAFLRRAREAPPRVRRQFLSFLVERGEVVNAARIARSLSQSAAAADLPALHGFCNLALAEGRSADAAAVRKALHRRGLASAAFDWHVEPAAGVRIEEFPGEWRVRFSGEQAEICQLAWQYVLLEPGRRYRLKMNLAATGGSSTAGIGWAIFYRTANGVWTESIPARAPSFVASGDLVRFAVTYRRPFGEARLAGEVTIRGIDLKLEE